MAPMMAKSSSPEQHVSSLDRCQSRVRLLLRILITLLCVSLCSYQLYVVSMLYFKYPTTVDIRLDPSPFVHLPGVTVCSELSSTILVEELVKIQPALYKVFAGKTRTEISLLLKKASLRELLVTSLQSLPLDQQHNMTVSSGLFFRACQVPTPLGRIAAKNSKGHRLASRFNDQLYSQWSSLQSYDMINCEEFSPVVETISHDFKCFTLFHSVDSLKKGGDSNYQIPKDVVGNLKYLAYITLNRDFMFNGLVYIHPPDMSHQFASTSNIQQLEPDKFSFVSVAFERTVLQLLEAPYETNCHDYKKDGYACRDDCMTDCKTRRYLKLDGWPGDVFANRSVSSRLSKVWSNTWSSVGHMEEGMNAESLATCSFECGHWDDCYSVQYDVRTVRVKERDEDDALNSHRFTLGILPPKNVQLISSHVPKYEPIEFLIYAGGLVSLYTGISAISLGFTVLSLLTFTNKYMTYVLCCGRTGGPGSGRAGGDRATMATSAAWRNGESSEHHRGDDLESSNNLISEKELLRRTQQRNNTNVAKAAAAAAAAAAAKHDTARG